MRLTLDWDSEALRQIHEPAVRQRSPHTENQARIAQFIDADEAAGGNKYELWQSSSHGFDNQNGYHYIEYNESGNLQRIRQLRTAYGDDALRVSLDALREDIGSPFQTVLYHLKNVTPSEYPPYSTNKRAELLTREGFDDTTAQERGVEPTKQDGEINYPELIKRLSQEEYFGSYGALYSQVQNRPSVDVDYSKPRQRASAVANRKRTPGRGERQALRDYAKTRDIGHYGEETVDQTQTETEPDALRNRPHRTTIHEYFEMPDIDFGSGDFGNPDSDDESEYFPVNIRTGRYRPSESSIDDESLIDETTLKQIHDRIADEITDVLSPGVVPTGQDERQGVNISRWNKMISIERDRPLDKDEFARYRNTWHENQPNMSRDRIMALHQSAGIDDAFSQNIVHFEVIVYDGDDALESNDPPIWWLVHGIVDASNPDNRRRPIYNSTLVADTRGFLK